MTIKEALDQQSIETIPYKWIVFGIDRWETDRQPIRGYDELAEGELNIKCRAKAEYTTKALLECVTLAIGKGEIVWVVDPWYHFWIKAGELCKTHINPLKNHYKANVSNKFGQEAEARIFPNTLEIGVFQGMSEDEIRAVPTEWLRFLRRVHDKPIDITQRASETIVDYLLNERGNSQK